MKISPIPFFCLDKLTVVPYNQPSAANDMLRRFLMKESFVDIESPQIRYGDYSISNMYSMSNPTKAMEDSGIGHKHMHQPQQQQPPQQPTSISVATTSIAFLAGIICTVMFLTLWKNQCGGGSGYRRIPDGDPEFNSNGHKK